MPGRTTEGEQCPQKIVDDFGFCYALGVGLGTIINGVRGAWSGPRNRKMATAVEMIKRRVPQFACSFGLWGGAFGFAQCAFILYLHQDGIVAQAFSGGFAGGILNIRGGPHYMLRGFTGGFVLLGIMGIGERIMTKHQLGQQTEFMVKRKEFEYERELSQIKRMRPDLMGNYQTKSEDELEMMQADLEVLGRKIGVM